jgi:DNA-binding NarL/FixJ family response regulator
MSERPARILIVDDEPLNVDYLEQELECAGYVTASAANGAEALERVAADPPDLILLDVMMPELDGISALRILKGDPETRLIPVVLMTALNSVDDRVRGIEAGADDFLSKPVDDRELLARIRTALSMKRAIDATVGELRTTSDHLAQYGRQRRDVVVLAIAWRFREGSLPEQAAPFFGRRERAAAERCVRSFGGMPTEDSGPVLLAIFDGPDPGSRARAALDAALTTVELCESDAESDAALVVSAALSSGLADVGSTRVDDGSGGRWVYGADGLPVDRATELAEAGTGILVGGELAPVVAPSFELEAVEGNAFRVTRQRTGEGDKAARRVRTILVTDIVGSTGTAERLGDRAWGELLLRHDGAVRAELARFGGEEIDTSGDGFLALFDAPGRAIRCALALHERLAALGLGIRAGVHTGEVDEVDGGVRGIAIHVATRLADRAAPGEVLVGATTRELAAGSGLVFVDRGEHELKGVSEARHLYAAVVDPADATAGIPGGADEYPYGLTAREVDVLHLVALGLSDAEAAERLFLSVRTVHAHLRSVYRKLGVRSRAEAARFAQENGLL